jgi:hypothetical protein
MTLEGGRSNRQRLPEVCFGVEVFTLAYHVPAAKRTREGTFPGGANKTSEKFGRLKLVLGAIPAVFATHEVRLFSPARNSLFTNTLLEIRRHRKQD